MWLTGPIQVKLGFDAEHCPDPVPGGYEWCMVYAGGSSAAHQWTQAELDRVKGLPRLPVWVPTPGTDRPVAAAAEFIKWLAGHNVPSIHVGPQHKPMHVLVDLETGQEPDPSWVNAFCGVLAKAGYWNLVYGSISTTLAQPPRSGYVIANPTNPAVPHLYQHDHVVGTQFAFDVRVPGGVIDQSVLDASVAGRLWMP